MGYGALSGTTAADARFASGVQAYDRRTGIPWTFPQPAGVVEVAGPGGSGLRSGEASVLPAIPVRGVGGAYYLLGRQVRLVDDPDFGLRFNYEALTVGRIKDSALPSSVFG